MPRQKQGREARRSSMPTKITKRDKSAAMTGLRPDWQRPNPQLRVWHGARSAAAARASGQAAERKGPTLSSTEAPRDALLIRPSAARLLSEVRKWLQLR